MLYVDDEPENLRIFELAFRREFSIVTAQNGSEGLSRLNAEPVALVLSDHKMPGMTGVEFLERAHELDPKTVRILVTAYGDAETLGEAINGGAIYKFVAKPWQPEEMRVTLRRGIEAYALDRERDQLVHELSLLNHVGKVLSQELNLERVIEVLLGAATRELGYDGSWVFLFDPERGSLGQAHMAPRDEGVERGLEGLVISQDNAPGFLGRLREGKTQHLNLGEIMGYEAPVRRWLTEVAADEVLVVPLVGKGGPVGALALDNRRGGRSFDCDDETLLEGLTNQAVIAIENARLVEDLSHSREQVRRVDRLGTLGTLAAGLAHEINNPLVSIHTFLSMVPEKRSEEDTEFWDGFHGLACREVERIRRLVDTMRTLGRDTNELAKEPVDAGELAAEVTQLVQREASRAQVRLELERDPAAPKVLAVRDHLHQVMLNLLLNGLQATPSGGSVELRILPDPDGEQVCIEVADSGRGIAEEDLDRIFDPFFTTKGPRDGTGLGLMVCHRLVTGHGGTIEVRSREGEGSVFCVRLPTADDRGAPARA